MVERDDAAERNAPLIQAVRMDAMQQAIDDWNAADDSLTRAREALEGTIQCVQAELAAAGCEVSEVAGQPVNSPETAIQAMEAARGQVAQAVSIRHAAQEQLSQAHLAAEDVLRQAQQVKLVRWVLGAAVVMLIYLRIRF